MRVGFLAPEGTFTWETTMLVAKERGWPADTEFVPYANGDEVIAALDRGELDYGMVAGATSLAAEFPRVRERIGAAANVQIVGECQRVCHYTLMAKPGARLDGIRTVRSAQKAFDDCAGWLTANLPAARAEASASTGAGAAIVAAASDLTLAAIAPPAAAVRHGLEPLAENIEDDPQNWTRWLVLGRR